MFKEYITLEAGERLSVDLGLGVSLLFLCDRVSGSPGWPQTHLGSQIFLTDPPKGWITGAPCIQCNPDRDPFQGFVHDRQAS